MRRAVGKAGERIGDLDYPSLSSATAEANSNREKHEGPAWAASASESRPIKMTHGRQSKNGGYPLGSQDSVLQSSEMLSGLFSDKNHGLKYFENEV